MRPQRRRVFLGCEGASERGYGELLRQLRDAQKQDVHLDIVLLEPGGGDPLTLVQRAERRIADREAKRERYAVRAVLLDTDQLDKDPKRDERADVLARKAKIMLIWQDPCHEGLLLRHLDGCRDRRPATCDQAERELKQRWPDYQKGMAARQLALRIGAAQLCQAYEVEPTLAEFLLAIGWQP
jgi:hypothetical protein